MIRAIAVVGPTAVGKTAFAIELARRIGGEIISADSMQIYEKMDIGTAKPTWEERAGVPHHMMDFLAPDTPYSAADYARDALECAREIAGRGKIPVFCGGTGLYLDAVRTGRHTDTAAGDAEYVRRMSEIAAEDGGIDRLHKMLSDVDPESAAAIHKNNVKRVIRALEIFHVTGIPKSLADRESQTRTPDVDMLIIGLDTSSREVLYERIDARVDKMLDMGLVDETRALYSDGYLAPHLTAAQAIGYKELLPHITDARPIAECTDTLKTASRRYAKRQLTWFRACPDVLWLTVDENGIFTDTARLVDRAMNNIEKFMEIPHESK